MSNLVYCESYAYGISIADWFLIFTIIFATLMFIALYELNKTLTQKTGSVEK